MKNTSQHCGTVMDVEKRLKVFLAVAASVTVVKLLLMPSYRSTDFEVHRNWLAVTSSLPITKWYTEATSQWTLDYPPLFAWFEYFLSLFAPLFDVEMLKISTEAYASHETVIFQRLTVIISDVVYLYAAYVWLSIIGDSPDSAVGLDYIPTDRWFHPNLVTSMLFVFSPGLLMVDHIHFQYNGFLSGLLLLSLARMVQRRELESAFWFAVLLNFKHIYIYIAPAYFVYLLRRYCLDLHFKLNVARFVKLAAIVAAVFGISVGPFIVAGQGGQLLSRLFPFKRGLSHAYWAPNFWSLYNTLDKVLSIALGKKTSASMTSGLVQEFSHTVLPSVPPFVTFALVAIACVPILRHLWERCPFAREAELLFLRSIVICAFASFIFGWHVHEKAILLVILPLTPLVMFSELEANLFLVISATGYYSLFPLLHRVAETPTKILFLLMHLLYAINGLRSIWCGDLDVESSTKKKQVEPVRQILQPWEQVYINGFIAVQAYYSFGNHVLGLDEKLPFLPLMLTSFYCAIGVLYTFVKYYRFTLTECN